MEKSVLEMVGGEKHINPHYDIKAESTSCYPVGKGFTGIEVNGVRFSNIGEMLRYMDRQREQLTKAKDIMKRWIDLSNSSRSLLGNTWHETVREAEDFLNSEVEK